MKIMKDNTDLIRMKEEKLRAMKIREYINLYEWREEKGNGSRNEEKIRENTMFMRMEEGEERKIIMKGIDKIT